MDTQTHVMLIEDDMSLAQWFSDYLNEHGYAVSIVTRGDLAVEMVLQDRPDIVLLDIMLPGKDGLDVCKELRPRYQGPILMMTARDEEMDEVLGLEIGADDYVTKPIKPRVMLSRIKALLRRETTSPLKENEHALTFGNLSIRTENRTVLFAEKVIKLTSNEFDVLHQLATHAPDIVSREFLSKQIRGIEYDGFDRSMDIIVSRLRKKLNDDASNPYKIKTIWGKGYMFIENAWDEL
ncbi:response regulator [Glaciecola sp. KUL10]|uniref:response regulator n=1 Tax=Glaciecola sp. (strain KUL10) TaxID=2161813 RepID=UPI00358E145C